MASNLSAVDLWSDLAAVREHSPLVHCITNLVGINFNANVLLAAIGGIHVSNASAVLRAGADGLVPVRQGLRPRTNE
jgi:thiamine monophosphate synthase